MNVNTQFGTLPNTTPHHSFVSLVSHPVQSLDIDRSYRHLYDTPPDGDCLFWSVLLAVFTPIIESEVEFASCFNYIFESFQSPAEGALIEYGEFYQLIKSYDGRQLYGNEWLKQSVIIYLRKCVQQFMQLHKESFRYFIEDNEDIDTYISNILQPGFWGGECEIKALSEFFSIKIYVVQEGVDYYSVYSPSSSNEDKSIYLKHMVYKSDENSAITNPTSRNHYGFLLSNALSLSTTNKLKRVIPKPPTLPPAATHKGQGGRKIQIQSLKSPRVTFTPIIGLKNEEYLKSPRDGFDSAFSTPIRKFENEEVISVNEGELYSQILSLSPLERESI